MEMSRQRFATLERVLTGDCPVIVAPMEALMDKYPEKEVFSGFLLRLKAGDTAEISELNRRLVMMGYERAASITPVAKTGVRPCSIPSKIFR